MMKEILKVKQKSYLTPNYIRVVLEGNVQAYENAKVGDNNKIIVPNAAGEIRIPVTPEDRKEITIRTYTTRAIDFENNTLTIDFVAHGEDGPASAWAIHAKVGDELGVLMKVKEKSLFAPADWYLLVADHTALPVVAVILETLPKDAKGKVIIEVYSQADVLSLDKPVNVEIEWVFNTYPGEDMPLMDAIRAIEFPAEQKFIFAAAEYHFIKEFKHFFKEEKELESAQWNVFSYWKYGQSENVSAEDRSKIRNA
ncbi:siderophore-interacting protein [Myroides sp. LJL119]